MFRPDGRHRFFEDKGSVVRDIRRVPFKFGGYSVSHRNGHASVRVYQENCKQFKWRFYWPFDAVGVGCTEAA